MDKERMPRREGFRHLAGNARWALGVARMTHPQLAWGFLGITIVRGLIPAALALVMRELINNGVATAEGENPSLTPFMVWLVLGLLLTVIEAVSRFANNYITARLTEDVDIRITTRILEHAATLDVAFFEHGESQDVIERAQRESATQISYFLSDIMGLLGQLVQALSLAVVIIAIEPLVLFLLVPMAGLHLLFQWRISKGQYILERNRATRRRWTAYFAHLLTTRERVPETNLLRLGPVLIARFRKLVMEFRTENRLRLLQSMWAGAGFAVLTTVLFYGVFARVVLRVAAGSLTVGDIAVFGMAGLRLRSALEMMASSAGRALARTLYISNIQEFFAQKPRVCPSVGAAPSSCQGAVIFENVSFTYPGAPRPALQNINLTLKPGETVALVGENGSGKTTLTKLLSRFYDPAQGRITLDGVDLADLSLDFLHGELGFVFQEFGKYEATLHDNIAYANWSRLQNQKEQVREALVSAGVGDIAESLPEGAGTLLGRRFGEIDLSQGQWQRLAVARAFARNASVLILDEPTASMDVRAEYDLLQRFRRLAHGRTTLLISHRFSTVRTADRIAVLHEGRITEQGTHDELIRMGGYYAGLYALNPGGHDPETDSEAHGDFIE